MIYLIGDSNLRETYNEHKKAICETAAGEVIFEQATTNEAVSIALEKGRGAKPKPELFYISTLIRFL